MRWAVLALVVTSTATSLVWGQSQELNAGAIYLCNVVALRIRTAAGGLSLDDRREAIRLRIVRAYAQETVTASIIRLIRQGADWVVTVGATTLVTVTEADGRANGTTAEGLARVWVERLRALMPRCAPQPLPRGP
ncbi:MAG: hypothetical protein QN188_02515 [Armatimonadota bacterium]|nr:hypothetical protein [Armatimonadota bacterium]